MDDVPAEGYPVKLYQYDLSRGLAASLSQAFLGRHIDAVWHTSIVVYGQEYYFGSSGIQNSAPGGTVLGNPLKTENLGNTFIPKQTFLEYLTELNESTYRGSTYDLFNHNCNNFSNEIAQFLVGKEIPKEILDLPQNVLSSPFGAAIPLLLSQVATSGDSIPNLRLAVGPGSPNNSRGRDREDSPDLVKLNSDIEEAKRESQRLEEKRNRLSEKLARRERKEAKKKKNRRDSVPAEDEHELEGGGGDCRRRSLMADTEVNGSGPQEAKEPSSVVSVLEEEEKREREERRAREEERRLRDPPIIFRDACDARVDLDKLVGLIDGKLSPEEQQSLEELHQYMLEDEGSWALGDGFLNFVGRLLHDKSLPPEVRVHTLHVLAMAALKDDSILLLHQDRREHVLMNYAADVDKLTLEEQRALALFMANLFENSSSSEWLLYISEWQYCNNSISNYLMTVKVAVHALLSDDAVLQDRGSAIIHNMAIKEVFFDGAVDLAIAVLWFLQKNPCEEQLFRALKALARFCQLAPTDVPPLIPSFGPQPSKFKGTSPRIDEQIQLIQEKLR